MKDIAVTVARPLGGLQTTLPQAPTAASLLTNWTVDKATNAWSSKVGYERYRPDPLAGFDPFTSTWRIDSLHVYQGASTGSRQIILFESRGTLYLLHEAVGSNMAILALATGRRVPSAGQPGSTYTDVAGGVVICNGEDTPVFVRPWPLGGSADASSTIDQCIRSLGFATVPGAPDPLRVVTMASTPTSITRGTSDAVCLWWPVRSTALGQFGEWGLGRSTNTETDPDQTSTYAWAVSFLSDTGSESALSTVGTSSWLLRASVSGFRYCAAIRIPVGPLGTAGRRIYRTKNYSNDGDQPGDTTLFYVDDVRNNLDELFFDPYETSALGAEAPSLVESTAFPAPRARVSAVFADCLWLDGGTIEPNILFHSHPGRPDQYGASSFVRVPSNLGGVVGMLSHYTTLIVFCESGICVVNGTFSNGFTVSSITSQVACRSPHAADSVPGMGVLFLAEDGVYVLRGGLVGGSEMSVECLSDPITSILSRATSDCMARAQARYSPTERAWHCYFAVDGNERSPIGIVWHVERQGWSIRDSFPVSALDRVYNGTLLFGHDVGTVDASNEDLTPECGLFVITAVRHLGGAIVDIDDVPTFVPGNPPTSVYRSAWQDFGDPNLLKQVHYVTLWVQTTGSFGIEVNAYKDFRYDPAMSTPGLKLQPPDQALLPVYGDAALLSGETAIYDTSAWQIPNCRPIRYDVATESCTSFAFEVVTTDDVVLVAWEIGYGVKGTRVTRGHAA